jgi:hypothetical protein
MLIGNVEDLGRAARILVGDGPGRSQDARLGQVIHMDEVKGMLGAHDEADGIARALGPSNQGHQVGCAFRVLDGRVVGQIDPGELDLRIASVSHGPYVMEGRRMTARKSRLGQARCEPTC